MKGGEKGWLTFINVAPNGLILLILQEIPMENVDRLPNQGLKLKKKAQLAANKVENEIANGTRLFESNITFKELTDEWFEHYASQVKISSVRARKYAIKHLLDIWGATAIKRITKHMYQTELDKLSRKFSRNYIESIHSTANMIFKYAIRKDLLHSSPSSAFIMPKS